MDEIDLIYYALLGVLTEDAALPWVENAFTPGSPCALAYQQIYDAYGRLRQRLDSGEEDRDVEYIIDAFTCMQEELCRKMFHCGVAYAQRDK